MDKIAWEDRKSWGFGNALYYTIKESLFNPSEFFKSVPLGRGFFNPILYTWLLIFLSVLLTSIFNLAFLREETFLNFEKYIQQTGMLEVWNQSGYKTVLNIDKPTMEELFEWSIPLELIMKPFSIIVIAFIYGLIMKFILQFFVGDKVSYRLMFRIFAYGYGTALFFFIPVIGPMIASSWHLLLAYRGIMVCYEELRPFEGMAVVFGPMFVFMILLFMFGAAFQAL